MLVSIAPKYSVSQIMGYLKGKSSLMIYEKYANLKYKYGNRHFWCRGYYVSTVGRNRRAIGEYIKNELRGWQTFRRAYRLSPGHAPRGLVQTTGTASGYDLCPYFFFALFQLRNSITTNGIPR